MGLGSSVGSPAPGLRIRSAGTLGRSPLRNPLGVQPMSRRIGDDAISLAAEWCKEPIPGLSLGKRKGLAAATSANPSFRLVAGLDLNQRPLGYGPNVPFAGEFRAFTETSPG